MILRPGLLVLALAAALPAQESSDPGPFEALAWRELGPAVFGGRIVDLALRPEDRSALLVASGSGGLWRTRNHGTTWECIFEHERSFSIGDIAWDSDDPGVIWVGTGEANNQRSSYWGDGVYKTTDGGETWEHLGLPDSGHIGRIVLHPQQAGVAYVAALGHLYTANPERGLYKTEDGGATWRRVLFVSEDVGVVDCVVDPRDGDVVYAASYERRRRAWDFDGAGPGSAIWKSVNGGLSWKRLGGGLPEGELGRIGLDLFRGDPDIVYATVSNQNEIEVEPEGDPDVGLTVRFRKGAYEVLGAARGSGAGDIGLRRGDVLVRLGDVALDDSWAWFRALTALEPEDEVELVWTRGEERFDAKTTRTELERVAPDTPRMRQVGGQIYRSDDAGESWTKTTDARVGGSPAYYYGQIRVDPSDVDRAYVLGVPVQGTDDGGKTWRSDVGSGVHVDHHALEIDPSDGRRLVLGNDGGLAISYDRGETWDHYSNLPLAQFYAVGLDTSVPYRVYGGTQDNGTWGGPSRSLNRRGIGAEEWVRVGGGDGFYARIDPDDPATVYAESQFGALYRRDVERSQTSFIRPPREIDGQRTRFNWNSPILLSHHNPKIVYFGGNRLFKSFNRGDDWSQISADLTTADPVKLEGNVPHCTLTTIAESPLDPSVLLVGTDDGLVQLSRDGGLSWENLTGRFPGVPSNYWVSRVELSYAEAERAYVAFTGYREDDFRAFAYASEDLGQTWRRIDGDLPAEPVNVLKEDPANPEVLYAGTEFGVYVSLDRGESWSRLGAGLPTTPVHDLEIQPRDRELVLATHGRGFWALDVAAFAEADAAALTEPAALFPVSDYVAFGAAASAYRSGSRHWYGTNPPRAVTVTYHLAEDAPKDAFGISVKGADGSRLSMLDAPSKAGFHVVRWTGGRQGGGRGRRGGGLTPGEYSVELTLRGETLRQSFRVVPDPRFD